MPLGNCDRCGKIFMTSVLSNTCPHCTAEEEKMLIKVQRFIKDNPSMIMDDVAKEFEIDIEQILKWIDERRLIVSKKEFLIRHCENCGTSIVRGRICLQCQQNLSNPSLSPSSASPAKEVRMANTKITGER